MAQEGKVHALVGFIDSIVMDSSIRVVRKSASSNKYQKCGNTLKDE